MPNRFTGTDRRPLRAILAFATEHNPNRTLLHPRCNRKGAAAPGHRLRSLAGHRPLNYDRRSRMIPAMVIRLIRMESRMAFHFSDCQLTYHSAPTTWMMKNQTTKAARNVR